MDSEQFDAMIEARLRLLLLEMARHQEHLAYDELAETPYWSPCPVDALGHRTAADALRAEADLLLAAS